MRVLDFMGQQKFTSYIFASKDDPFQRARWRDPYPHAQLAQLRSEISYARQRGIHWIPNISPAKPLLPTQLSSGKPSEPLCFSCRDDLKTVVDKLSVFRDAGSDTFMVSFDDVTQTLSNPSDLQRFGTGEAAYGRANAYFLNHLQHELRKLSSDVKLITVGAQYAGTSGGAYLQNFGRYLNRQIEVMWTGTGILSKNFTPNDALSYARVIRRKPILWDNWTSTDTTGANSEKGSARIFLGPYVRNPQTARKIEGVFINPMNLPVLNELSLATAGKWMQDPDSYRPRKAWLSAVQTVASRWSKSKLVRETLRAWAESSYATRLSERNAPTFSQLSKHLVSSYDDGGLRWNHDREALLKELTLVEQASSVLGKNDSEFRSEASEFLIAARRAAMTARIGVKLLDAKRGRLNASGLERRFEAAAAAYRQGWQLVYGWRGMQAQDLGAYPVPENAIEKFAREIKALN